MNFGHFGDEGDEKIIYESVLRVIDFLDYLDGNDIDYELSGYPLPPKNIYDLQALTYYFNSIEERYVYGHARDLSITINVRVRNNQQLLEIEEYFNENVALEPDDSIPHTIQIRIVGFI